MKTFFSFLKDGTEFWDFRQKFEVLTLIPFLYDSKWESNGGWDLVLIIYLGSTLKCSLHSSALDVKLIRIQGQIASEATLTF